MMEFPYRPELVDRAARRFDAVSKIQSKDFDVKELPESTICKECDIKSYYLQTGMIAEDDDIGHDQRLRS